jgi:nucleoid-associated protein YgaU
MRTYARLISVAFLSLGLMAGCATTEDDSGSSAEQAISAAKAANADAKAAGYEWRDTGKIIKSAQTALDAGNDEEAIKLANKAQKQAEDALAQSKAENQKYLNSLSDADRAALAGAESSMSKRSDSGAVAGRVNSYSVTRGDNLWDISGKDSVYGNSYQWPLIYKTNRSKIKDADLIHPGQQLDIDQNASGSEIDAAVNHAKTRGAWSIGDVEQSDLDYLSK